MQDISAVGTATKTEAQAGIYAGAPAREPSTVAYFALLAAAAFGLYYLSSFVLQARNATTHFGADTWYYAELAKGNVIERIAGNYYLDRIARFHLTTVAMAAAWMKLLEPLTQWITPLQLLKVMFAAVGAVGVWAATSAFAAVVERRYAILFGIIYGISFSVWYFASIEESKIVTASLSALYIAGYLQLRRSWTMRGAVLLTGILFIACLNEMVSGFLIIIPIVDTLMQRGWDWRHGRWIAAHALAGPIALVMLEGVLYGRLVAQSHPEGASHVGMLIYYITRNSYGAETLYSFVINWLFFNIAAPTADASHSVPAWANYKGYFEPALANYFSALLPAALVVLFAVMVAACVLSRHRAEVSRSQAGILLGLSAYTLLRGMFFIIFNPYEPLLFSSAVTLAHMLLIGIPFAASKLPAKGLLLAALALLLFAVNGAFIVGPRI